MKVLLINPQDDLKSFIGSGRVFVSNLEPLGLLYIAAACREAGHNVSVIDAFAERLSDMQLNKRISEFDPDVIGFTSFTSNGGFLYTFGQKLKAERPKTLIVFGNTHASVYAEQYLKNECCDIVVHGEGEHTFLRILKENKNNWGNIPSISYLVNDQFVTTSKASYIDDLSKLPIPARDLLIKDLYDIGQITNMRLTPTSSKKKSKHMFTSRGCPNRCLFCTVHHNSNQRFNAVNRVVDEMEMLIKDYNADYIFIMDSIFTSNRKRVHEICDEILKRKLNFMWGCEAHAAFMDIELAKKMEKAGCCDLNFGIESGVQKLLDKINKNLKTANVEKTLKEVKENTKINTTGLFILGLPGETYEDSLTTIEFSKKLPIDMAQFSILVPFPGSQLYKELSEGGEIDTGIRKDGTIDTSVWGRYSPYISYTDNLPIWTTKEQTGESLKMLQKRALRSFYFRPHQLMVQLKRIRISDIGLLLKAFKDTFF